MTSYLRLVVTMALFRLVFRAIFRLKRFGHGIYVASVVNSRPTNVSSSLHSASSFVEYRIFNERDPARRADPSEAAEVCPVY